jgi:hypothetical protein
MPVVEELPTAQPTGQESPATVAEQVRMLAGVSWYRR